MGRVVSNAIPHRVERGQEEQGQDCGDKETAHHRIGHGSPEHFSGDRYQPENRRRGRQQDGPKSVHHGIDDRMPSVHLLIFISPESAR